MNDLIIKSFIKTEILPETITIKEAVKLARLSFLEGVEAGEANKDEFIQEIVDGVINNRITKKGDVYLVDSTEYTFEELMILFKRG